MLKPRWFRKRRGIALILALLTTVILVTLSLAFMSLSITEARTSRSYGFEETSIQAAGYGLEYALVYMGHGTTGVGGTIQRQTWDFMLWPNPGGNPNSAFGFYNVLRPQPAAAPVSGVWVTVSDINTDPTLATFPISTSPNEERTPDQVRADLRRLRFVLPNSNQPAALRLTPELAFTCDVVIEPVLVGRNQGRHDYKLTSTARIFTVTPDSLEVTGPQSPLATRVVEARVKESSFDYAHFIANGRTWNAQGIPLNTIPIAIPNPNNPGATISLADYVMIPRNYVENGPMRIDGQNRDLIGTPGVTPNFSQVLANSGNLRFQQGANDGGVVFTHKLTINQAANEYNESGLDDTTMGGFSGGFNPLANRVGIPDFRREDMIRAAQFRVEDTDRSGFYEVRTSDIPGALGNTPSAPLPRGTDPDLGPFYDLESLTTGPNGEPIKVGKDIDFRPRVPNIEVNLNGNQITVTRRDTLTNQVIGAPETFSQENLKMGILYVEGGNVVVKTDPNGKFQGRLSIVAGERPGRETITTANNETIYAQAAREFFNYEKARWDHDKRTLGALDPSQYFTPPYTAAQLNQALQQGAITTPLPPGVTPNQPLWPAPPASVDPQGNVKYDVEREGNLIIADDVVYDGNVGNSLGLFAQNFVLLNDNTPSDTLTIDAVMMSKERSVSLDWDNTGRQDPAAWAAMMRTTDENGNPMRRKVRIRGSVIGEYIDVEGDAEGRGYNDQEFTYDPSLRNASPPFMPRPLLHELPGGFRYMILHYLDRGSLNTAGALGS